MKTLIGNSKKAFESQITLGSGLFTNRPLIEYSHICCDNNSNKFKAVGTHNKSASHPTHIQIQMRPNNFFALFH